MLDELVKTALVGTGRAAVELPPGPVADAVAGVASADAESRLLSAVAVASQYAACGRVPAAVDAVPPPAEGDDRPACSARGGDLLEQALAAEPRARQQLLAEWLGHADRAGRRVPHALLPALLDRGVADPSVRAAVVSVAGQRGAWLARLNPRWRAGLAEPDGDPADGWTTAKADRRLAAVGRLRATDPARAVELVASTWAEDAADERAAFVDAMAVGLSAADELFLEAALDDRSKIVRTSAADLLARLPASAFVARMAGRAEALLRFGGKRLSVELPAAFDPAWERDGISEKSPSGLGPKQSWLRQIVAAVPPAHWSAAWGLTPAACIEAVPKEHVDLLLEAWDAAAARSGDPAWVEALLAPAARHGRRPARVELLDALPAAARPAVVARLLRAGRGQAEGLMDLVHRTRFAFDGPTAEVLFEQVDRHAGTAAGKYDLTVTYIMEAVALRVPAGAHDGLAERWSGPAWEPYRRAIDACLAVLKLRWDIEREFAT